MRGYGRNIPASRRLEDKSRDKGRHEPGPPQAGGEAAGVFLREIVAPDSQHAPAGAAEGAGDEAVAGLVAGDLGPPKFRVLLGLRGVYRAAVPKTAVHENRQLADMEK